MAARPPASPPTAPGTQAQFPELDHSPGDIIQILVETVGGCLSHGCSKPDTSLTQGGTAGVSGKQAMDAAAGCAIREQRKHAKLHSGGVKVRRGHLEQHRDEALRGAVLVFGLQGRYGV